MFGKEGEKVTKHPICWEDVYEWGSFVLVYFIIFILVTALNLIVIIPYFLTSQDISQFELIISVLVIIWANILITLAITKRPKIRRNVKND